MRSEISGARVGPDQPLPPARGRAAPFVFAGMLAGVFVCAFAGVFVDLDLIKHPKVHSKYIIKSIPSQTCICARLSGAVGVSVCLWVYLQVYTVFD